MKFRMIILSISIGPLHNLIIWYKIKNTGEQVAQWDFQNNAPAFVLEVPLPNLLTSIFNFLPCDWVVQRASYCAFCKHADSRGHISNNDLFRLFHTSIKFRRDSWRSVKKETAVRCIDWPAGASEHLKFKIPIFIKDVVKRKEKKRKTETWFLWAFGLC